MFFGIAIMVYHGDFIGSSWGFFRGLTNRRRDVWLIVIGHIANGLAIWVSENGLGIHPSSRLAMAGHREKVDETGCHFKVGEQQH